MVFQAECFLLWYYFIGRHSPSPKNGFWQGKNLFLGDGLCRPMPSLPEHNPLDPWFPPSLGLAWISQEWRHRAARHVTHHNRDLGGSGVWTALNYASFQDYDRITSIGERRLWSWLHAPLFIIHNIFDVRSRGWNSVILLFLFSLVLFRVITLETYNEWKFQWATQPVAQK